ncbi:MAG: primosomal protein N' [Clostridiales bacterium]|nr:primosomal protein N' [Clostridiales bacterium]
MKYVDVVIDNKSNSTDALFTYKCEDDAVSVGSKVYVPFAKSRKPREGYVVSVSDDASQIEEAVLPKLRAVERVDDEVSLTEEMVRSAMWMRGRYLCRYIDAVRCFTPAGSAAVRREKQNSLAGERGFAEQVEQLTGEQEDALNQIIGAIEERKNERFLIHGVTGSGKTEVYIRAAKKALEEGRGVIILVPEISLTGQIIERFLGNFGEDSVAVLHSRLSAGERYDQWKRVRDGKTRIVIGARSAVFAPVENLGLIVVDEEHESTYKSDFTPKYDTIEVAVKRLQDQDSQGVLILGSATPSVVTYSRAKEGIYKLIELTKRYNEAELPKTEIVDMRAEMKDGNRSMLSRRLVEEMHRQLDSGRQVMLFLNRRGYSTFVSCRECGYVAKCPTCGLSLTYHRGGRGGSGKLVCHYCGHEEAPPEVCPECGSSYVRYFGSGTEKIEETIRQLFPEHTSDRLDLDSIKKKGELKKKLKDFEKGRTDILIGTQLIAKGLDFKNVGLVGIVSADVSLNIPDFRSPERAFQLITQAAGRAGRGTEEGKVIIQTYSPEHYAVVMAAEHDYKNFYEAEDKFRRFMMYPPYSDIFQIVFTSDVQEAALAGAEKWHKRLDELLPEEDRNNLFQPQEAYMSKIRDTYRYSLVLKCPRGKRHQYAGIVYKVRVEEIEEARKKKQDYNAVVDINPYSFS